MSTIIVEGQFSPESNDGENPSAKRTWFLFGAVDELTARADMAPYLVPYKQLVPRSISLEPVGFQSNQAVYKAVVQYGVLPSAISGGDEDVPSFAFEFGGSTAKMLSFLAPPARFAPSGGTAIDNNGFINVKEDGSVEGVEVPVPSFSFSLTRFFSLAAFTPAYQNAVGGCVKRVNNSHFLGHAAGTVLLDQATGSGRGQAKVEITFRFSVSPDATLSVGDISGIKKPGWHYLSITSEQALNAAGDKLVPKPIGVEVGPVFFEADFSVLGLS